MSFSEIIIIAVVAVLVLGPEKLPSTLVELAKLIKGIKKQINEAKRAVEDEINIAELREEAERYKREIAAANESVRKRLSLEDFEQIGDQVRGAGEQLREAGEQVREELASARAAGSSAFAAAALAAEANVLPDGSNVGGVGGAEGAGGSADSGVGSAEGAQVSPDAAVLGGRPERVSGAEGANGEENSKNRQPGGRRAAWKQAALAIGNDAPNIDDAGSSAGDASGQAPGGASALREQISATSAGGSSATAHATTTATTTATAAQMSCTQENSHA